MIWSSLLLFVFLVLSCGVTAWKGLHLELPWLPMLTVAGLFVYAVYYSIRSFYISCVALSLAKLVWFATTMAILTDAIAYDCVTVDSLLQHIDLQLGLSAVGITEYFQANRWMDRVSQIAYFSLIPQIMLALLWQPSGDRLINRMMWGGLITVAIFAMIPAFGSYVDSDPQDHNQPILNRMIELSAGSVDTLRIQDCEGIICAPSFHTICGVLLIAAMWNTPVRWFSVVLNVLLIISTVPTGGHYVIDVILGLVVAAIVLRCDHD